MKKELQAKLMMKRKGWERIKMQSKLQNCMCDVANAFLISFSSHRSFSKYFINLTSVLLMIVSNRFKDTHVNSRGELTPCYRGLL